MDTDTAYWTKKRAGEDDQLHRASVAAYNCEREVIAGERLGLKPYTWAWAEWSRRWHDAGRPADGAAALEAAKRDVPAAY